MMVRAEDIRTFDDLVLNTWNGIHQAVDADRTSYTTVPSVHINTYEEYLRFKQVFMSKEVFRVEIVPVDESYHRDLKRQAVIRW